MWFTLEPAHKAQHLALTLSQELILALTLTKLVLKSKDVFTKHLVGSEVFADIYMGLLLTPTTPKWPG